MSAPEREPLLAPRSLFFVPGGRPDMIAKVGRWAPDIAVVDLEDAVGPEDKLEARRAAVGALAALTVPAGTTVTVRINPPGTPWYADDVAAVAATSATGVVLPKVEHPDQIGGLRAALAGCGRRDFVVVAGIETALGVADCRAVVAGADAVYFGAEDYIADMGGRRSAGGLEALYARSQVCLAARLALAPAIDQAVVAVRDDDRFRADCEQGLTMGYAGKICVHPRQVEIAHEVFTPTAAELRHAEQVLDAARAGVGVVDGEMVDAVHVRLADAVVARARRAAGR